MNVKFIKEDIRWGIIGCGDVCEVKSGPAFSKINHSTLAAVMRRNEEKAKDYAWRHGVPKYYTSAEQLINDPNINAIYIATPPSNHEEYALKAMEAGKPVYIEKPLAMNATSCKRILDAALRYQVPATGAYYRRALPLFQKVKSLLEEQMIGKIKLVIITTLQSPSKSIITKTDDNWRVNPALSGGGLFHDLAPHQLDLMYWFFGKPTGVIGRSLNQDKKYEAPDLTTLEAIFPDDVLLSGLWSFNVHESAVDESCKIIGEKGMLKFSFFQQAILEMSSSTLHEVFEFVNPPHIQQPMIEQVVRYFRGEGTNPCSLADALVSMQMMDSTMGYPYQA
jgi:1,5-anhydro-D-fructose reductase (1,5-anhydro-D-mannitol-forming)